MIVSNWRIACENWLITEGKNPGYMVDFRLSLAPTMGCNFAIGLPLYVVGIVFKISVAPIGR
jgi:hypothetical protein